WRAREDGFVDDLMLPTRDAPFRVHCNLHAVQGERAVESALDVVLAGPDEMHRSATLDCLNHFRELKHPIRRRVAAPSETAAAILRVDPDLLGFEPEHLRDH